MIKIKLEEIEMYCRNQDHKFIAPWLDELPFEWSILERLGKQVEYRKNEVIFHYNDPVEYVYVVKTGRVRLYLISNLGDEKTIAIIGRSGILGESSIYQNQTYFASAITASPTSLIKLRPDDFKRVIMENQSYILQVLEMMSLKVQLLSQHSLQLAFYSSFQRVCHTFVQLGLTYGEKQDAHCIKISIPFTHQELANLVGTSRVTVATHVKSLIESNTISKVKKHYYIKDIERLTTKSLNNI
jgi:CRP/FNR family cyclic AMP-dependent transcriptional regulator